MNEFKVGDFVKNIGRARNSAVCSSNDYCTIEGKVGKITKVGWSRTILKPAYEITWSDGKTCGKSHTDIVLAKPHEIPFEFSKHKISKEQKEHLLNLISSI